MKKVTTGASSTRTRVRGLSISRLLPGRLVSVAIHARLDL